jgi:glycosyltransferase involved in cell wall biosynthesis
MKVAVWSPLPPAPTGVADYAVDQARDLAAHADVTLVSAEPAEVPGLRVSSPASPGARDVDLFHVGNSPPHGFVLREALRAPGVVLLHESNIHDLWLAETVERGDTGAYMKEMRSAYGSEGLFAAERIATALGGAPFRARYPLVERVVQASLGVIASTGAILESRAVRGALGFRPSLLLPHPFWLPDVSRDRAAARARFGVPAGSFLIVAPGLATEEKRVDRLIRALAALGAERDPRLLVAGDAPGASAWRELARSLGVVDRLTFTGRLSLEDLALSLVAADAVSALRHGDRGEMSGVAIRAMGIGRAVLVSAGSTLSREFPEGAVVPILPSIVPGDDLEQRHLTAALAALSRDQDLRASIEAAARLRIADRHDRRRAASALATFLEGVVRDRAQLVSRVERERVSESGLPGYLLQELRGLRDLGGAGLMLAARSLVLGLDAGPSNGSRS